ncbi:MAG: tetratricopeptide repeat protein, partial [Trichodesmium sp. St19_bin1]|nr:tetratricopeptide repeat protein [Trichodesmium sp. St19_bin1]
LPENHPSLAKYLNNLAGLYHEQGKYEAAEPLFLQAIDLSKIALPENHPERAKYLNNLALLYYSQGKYEAAEQLYLQAIEIEKIALPENYPFIATNLNNLALLYKSQGKYEAAEQLYLQAIEINKIALPENHPGRATCLNNLAELYRAQGKPEISLGFAASNIVEEAKKLAKQGQIEEAITLFKDAQELSPEIDLASNSEARETDLQLIAKQFVFFVIVEESKNLAKQGQIEEAIALFKKAQELSPEIDIESDFVDAIKYRQKKTRAKDWIETLKNRA